ncbi:MAG: glycosyltransferase family 2 protein [Candidatus Woesearchaeota archaeon]|jgi:dolichyl-phosphate beta-glucosyltransferase|nr:glycosyltransferase family 2 protein [Candidatus Woesearchaeota archaeon]
MNKGVSLSLVIPCYNEETRFSEQIRFVLKFLEKFEDKELILVNDGSSDDTLKLFEDCAKNNSFVKVVSYAQNKGKGYAIRRGVLSSSKDFVLISDMDLSTPLKDFSKLIKYVDDFDIVIGSRALENSNILKRQNLFKVFLGKSGNLGIRILLGLNINDTQCGFKLFKNSTKSVFKKSMIDGFGYDFELLFLFNKEGFKIKEVPVTWINDERSKVRVRDYFLTLLELFKVRINFVFGKYK